VSARCRQRVENQRPARLAAETRRDTPDEPVDDPRQRPRRRLPGAARLEPASLPYPPEIDERVGAEHVIALVEERGLSPGPRTVDAFHRDAHVRTGRHVEPGVRRSANEAIAHEYR
jgi:hypothetical protein